MWSFLASWIPGFRTWFGEGTPDDRRNFGWRLSEYLAVKVLWAWTILDVRIGHTGKDGIWRILDIRAPYRTQQNFWNAFLSIQIYLVAWRFFIMPKLHIVVRPSRKFYLLIATPGMKFDDGQSHAKFALMNWQRERDVYGCTEPPGWEEGSV